MVLIHIFEAARRFYHMLFKIKSYITFLIGGISKYSVHSPFLHHFIQDVLDHRGNFYCFPAIELVRKKLSDNKRTIKKLDLGAGSSYGNKNEIPINQILKQEQSSPKKAKLLFKMVNFYNPEKVLEMGTSLGFTTAYLANAKKNNEVLSVEADKQKCEIASKTINSLGIKNVKIINSTFSDLIETASHWHFNFIYFDGNHTDHATLSYFNWAVEKVCENDVFVFDDIYWSKEMNNAWKKIINHEKPTLTLDLFSLGIVFFDSNLSKQHIKLIHTSNFY